MSVVKRQSTNTSASNLNALLGTRSVSLASRNGTAGAKPPAPVSSVVKGSDLAISRAKLDHIASINGRRPKW